MLASASHAIATLVSPGFPSLLWQAGRYWRIRGKLPNVGLRSELKRRAKGRKADLPALPEWLAQDLRKELHLEDRWMDYYGELTKPAHPLRPEAYNLLCSPQWPPLFESYDPAFTGSPL